MVAEREHRTTPCKPQFFGLKQIMKYRENDYMPCVPRKKGRSIAHAQLSSDFHNHVPQLLMTSFLFTYLVHIERVKMSFCGWFSGEHYKDHFDDGK